MLPMELKISSPRPGLSHSGDPEEKEISDDDDDDRNHKHRRREAHSQSFEGDSSDQVLARPYRKRKRPFENGHPFGVSQPNETWKNHSMVNQERDSPGRFEKRRQNVASYSRGPLDISQRIKLNQSVSADPGPTRSKGRESSSWGQRGSRFSSVDIASQHVQQGPFPPSLFPGRGLPNVSNAQNASWNAFGLVPAIPNAGLDSLHTIGLRGAVKPSIDPPLSLGIPRPRCRDFEERGFCLRGDMCPMEHGVNRIVVEDVQSLSQFNLPVSLPSAHLVGTPFGQGSLPAIASSGTFINRKSLQNKSSKPGISDDRLGSNGASVGGSVAGGSDLYDPDQPLWENDCPAASPAPLALNPSNMDNIEPLLDADHSDHLSGGQFDGSDNEHPKSNAGVSAAFQSASASRRNGNSRKRSEVREKIDSTVSPSSQLENEPKKDTGSMNSAQAIASQVRKNADELATQVIGLSSKSQIDSGGSTRKPSQKAFRTLFVRGIPQKENKREALLQHFKKFGRVIDIYIPSNSERAFVQFSKREEAEAALKAPDAVMGNRFIKLWWANRDRIPDDGISGTSNLQANPQGLIPTTRPVYPSFAAKGKDNAQMSGPKTSIAPAAITPLHGSDYPKSVVSNGPKSEPPVQKKLENLELLKEELRKKQEMLDQKRNEFRRQLSKLEKQATGLKDEVASPSGRHKAGTVVDVAKIEMSKSSDSGTNVSSPQAEVTRDSGKSAEKAVTHGLKDNSIFTLPETSTLKPSIRPLAPLGSPFIINKFKLDNRPTAFKILPPLPTGFANVSVLKEHFSAYGVLSLVELEEFEDSDNESETSRISARISFTTRRSAERAFLNAKCWQGQNLQFMWLTSSNTSEDNSGKENHSASSKCSSDSNVKSAGEVETQCSLATLGNGDTENLEGRSSDAKPVEQDENLESSSTIASRGEYSP